MFLSVRQLFQDNWNNIVFFNHKVMYANRDFNAYAATFSHPLWSLLFSFHLNFLFVLLKLTKIQSQYFHLKHFKDLQLLFSFLLFILFFYLTKSFVVKISEWENKTKFKELKKKCASKNEKQEGRSPKIREEQRQATRKNKRHHSHCDHFIDIKSINCVWGNVQHESKPFRFYVAFRI